MPKHKKLLQKFLNKPKDFTFDELIKLLAFYEYELSNSGKTGGSRVRFRKASATSILMHKPHPKPILKPYQIEEVKNVLKKEGLI